MKHRALFLDRDGVVVDWVDYLSDPKHVSLKPGIIQLMTQARALSLKIFLVTNQSGLGRGLFSLRDYQAVQDEISRQLSLAGVGWDAVYMSPYYATGTNELSQQKPEWRKPLPGMFLAAQKDFDLNLSQSVMVGDSASDIEAADRAGVSRKYLLLATESELAKQRSIQEQKKLDPRWACQVIEHLNQIHF